MLQKTGQPIYNVNTVKKVKWNLTPILSKYPPDDTCVTNPCDQYVLMYCNRPNSDIVTQIRC